MEVANALSNYHREKVIIFIQQCYSTDNILVVNITPQLFQKGLTLYGSR